MTDWTGVSFEQQPGRWWARAFLLSAGYWLVTTLSSAFLSNPISTAAFWPANGLLLAWLLWTPRRDWGRVLLIASAARIIPNFILHPTDLTGAAFTVAAAVEAVVGASLIVRMLGGRRSLDSARAVLLGVLIPAMVSAPLGVALGLIIQPPGGTTVTLWPTWAAWCLGDALGIIVVVPLALSLEQATRWLRAATWPRRIEASFMLVTTIGGAVLAFAPETGRAQWLVALLAFVVIPFIWAALRLGVFAVAWAALGFSAIAAWGTVHGTGVFSNVAGSLPRQVLTLQAYLAVVIIGVLLVAATVDAQRRAVAVLRASEEKFRQLVDASPVAIAILDPDLRSVSVNPTLTALFGYDADELTTLDEFWERLVPDPRYRAEGRRAWNARIDDASRTHERVRPMEINVTCRDGSVRHVEARATRIGDRQSVAILDLTDRVRLEDQLRQAQKLEALGTLAGGIAHDFNNILGAIIGFVEFARDDIGPNHPAQAHLREVTGASQRAANLVRQILTFSRQQEQQRRVMAIGPVITEVAGLLRAAVSATVSIHVRIAPGIPAVLGDATQVHQVAMNLATNAVHAMGDDGGALRLELDAVHVGPAELRESPNLREGAYVRLAVTDTGPGIGAEAIGHIFEPFFTTKPAGQGTGLGLAVAHGIVTSHDGAITVQTALGHGTTFRIFFPAVAGRAAGDAAPAASIPGGQGERILFVDDEPSLTRMAERMLRALGYAPQIFNDPADAIAAVRADPFRFDAVITDLTMPGMSGLQLADQLLRIRPDLPILLASGFTATVTPEVARERGLKAVLQKPYTAASMAAALREVLRGDTAVVD